MATHDKRTLAEEEAAHRREMLLEAGYASEAEAEEDADHLAACREAPVDPGHECRCGRCPECQARRRGAMADFWGKVAKANARFRPNEPELAQAARNIQGRLLAKVAR